jgi:hypothetical protein
MAKGQMRSNREKKKPKQDKNKKKGAEACTLVYSIKTNAAILGD